MDGDARKDPMAATSPIEARGLRRAGDGFARRAALVQSVVSSVVLVAVVATVGAVLLKRVATGEALQDARAVTVAYSEGVLREHITPQVLDGDAAALRDLDRAVRARVLDRPIVRVKVWSPDGRIVYSDASTLIGRHFTLPDDLREALADDAVRAEVSDLSRPENRLERGRGRLVEVYLPLRIADGRHVIVEAYHPAGSIDAATARIWHTILPVPVALLIALAAVQVPLGWWHTRRARADAAERERLARAAERSLQGERGRIATEVHRGVVQELAGMAYQLQAAAIAPAADASEPELRGLLDRGAAVCRRTMTVLRELLSDPRPDEPAPPDFAGALDAIAAPLRARGVEVAIAVRGEAAVGPDDARLVLQAAREALANVHSRARAVDVGIDADGAAVSLVITDDGRRPGAPADADAEGHRHTSMLRLADAFGERGGSLSISSGDSCGTRIAARLPQRA
jgi:two-component system NarL family sensor kinase